MKATKISVPCGIDGQEEGSVAMGRWLRSLKSRIQVEHVFAEFVGVFFDRSQVGNALLAVERLRGFASVLRFFKKQ